MRRSSRPRLLDAVALTEAERALVAIDPGYATASTASRLDSFILPDSLQFAEYNAESPAGLGYSEKLAGCFEHLELLGRFRERFEASAFPLMRPMLDALLASYREWGGTASPPTIAIVDWRDVPTWAEFLILQAKFESLGVPTIVCTPRAARIRRPDASRGRPAHRPGLPPSADQRHPGKAGRVPGADRCLCGARGLRGQYLPLQDSAQEGVLRAAHR